jgi:hypothetical protein
LKRNIVTLLRKILTVFEPWTNAWRTPYEALRNWFQPVGHPFYQFPAIKFYSPQGKKCHFSRVAIHKNISKINWLGMRKPFGIIIALSSS